MYDLARTDSLKDFLAEQGVQRASELGKADDKFPRDLLIHFFNHVCVPEVLDQSLALDSTRAVEDERATILVLLIDLTLAEGQPPVDYLDELRTIKTRQLVQQTTLQLNQSKVYVNVDGIKKAAGPRMRERWHRYQLITHQKHLGADFHELQRTIQEKLGDQVTVLSLTPLTERDRLFRLMVYDFGEMFAISKEFGLDGNLSTNIRHGFIMRELRGPLLNLHLVTNKGSEEGGYQQNEYWKERVYQLIWPDVSAVLSHFSESVDEAITYLNHRYLRIKSEKVPEGLFDFTVTEVSLQRLQEALDGIDAYEAFVDGVIEFLWAMTNNALAEIRRVLLSQTLARFHSSIDVLQEDLREIANECDWSSDESELSGLLSASNFARADIKAAIERVASWFTLSANNEYFDYSLELSYDAGLATVHSYYSHLTISSSYSGPTIQMAGWTLPSFTRLFSILLDNAAHHSGIHGGTLMITAEAWIEGGLLYFTVRNPLAPTVDLAQLDRRIAVINDGFNREPASEVISQEGGSGFPKLWKILAHDLGGDHAIYVRLVGGVEFMVEIMIDAKRIVV